MKPFIFFAFVILVAACNSNSNEQAQTAITATVKVTDDSTILGKWPMCSEQNDTITIQFNVCPVISFMEDGAGMIKYSGFIELFNWNYTRGVEKGKLHVFYTHQYTNKLFADSVYYTTITKEAAGTSLTIADEKHHTLYLSR